MFESKPSFSAKAVVDARSASRLLFSFLAVMSKVRCFTGELLGVRILRGR